MRKKIILMTLWMLFAFVGMGCTSKEEDKTGIYEIYYLDRNENHIISVSYETEISKEDKQVLTAQLLEQLATQTEKIEYKPAISGFTVKNCILHEGQITLNLSGEYEDLPPVKEVLVRAALVKTLTQIEGIELINIQVEGKSLLDATGDTIGVMSADTFIDNTGEDMKKYEETTLTLYFANAEGNQLIKVNRTLRYNTNISLEKLVVEQLVSGPVDKKNKENATSIFATLNPEIKIISVNIKDGICYVNLNNGFLTLTGNVTADTAIYSLVNSLTELPGVVKVQLAVDGATEVKLGDKTLSNLFERNLALIQVEEAGEN
ncbi:MAG: GerMN domain-containing protein [Lachnospiraceae bacterium]|nr:GerMN domain-containing protein [Lachnospiraceae bacterium]